MAHYAFLDENNIVTEVITGIDETELIEGLHPEIWYGNFRGQKCVRTSYNSKIRGTYAGAGYLYNEELDIFIPPELDLLDYEISWEGFYQSDKPSIMLDSVPRSGIRWFAYLINESFPDSFKRWGYKYPHNPETFSKSKNKFDLLATVIRNPIDSLASSILFFNLDTEDKIVNSINRLISMLEQIKENKDFVDIFSFEDVINNPQELINLIGIKINLTPSSINILEIKNQFDLEDLGPNYVVPTDNQQELDDAKALLNDAKYAILLNTANSLYNDLLGSIVLLNE
jgi:hypothetical protein